MTELENIKTVYFLGIGGIGMSALARFFIARGIDVSGYDRTVSSLTRQLEKEGICVHYQENIEKIPDRVDLAVYTPAIPSTNLELLYLKQKETPLKKRAEVLGIISKLYFTIAVSGTHGKTSISSIVAHILSQNNIPQIAFIGGIAKNFDSNLVLNKDAEVLVAEADEFDRSFLHLNPDIALVSAIDPDHLDIYNDKSTLLKSFKEFMLKVDEKGKIIINKNIESVEIGNKSIVTYSLTSGDYHILPDDSNDRKCKVRCVDREGLFIEFTPYLSAGFIIENMVAAIAICRQLNISRDRIGAALDSYNGVERRFDLRIDTPELVYIDDYAHHPEEIKAVLKATRKIFTGKSIAVIFQPHLYSRTRDLANEFAESLEMADHVTLLPIYPAREEPVEGITSEIIYNKINHHKKQIISKEKLTDHLKTIECDVFITMGAGDIDRMVEAVEKLLRLRIG